jgi:hypothetical protein
MLSFKRALGGEQKTIIEAHIFNASSVFQLFSKKLAVSTMKGKSRLKPSGHDYNL